MLTGNRLSLGYETDREELTLPGETFAEPQSGRWSASLTEYLKKHLGIRYKLGGTSLRGFDCSGFSRHVYKNIFNVDLPHTVSKQYPSSLLSPVPSDELRPGDLIFFSATRKKKRVNHVGIYLDEGKFIHAQLKRGIVISDLDHQHWKSRLVSAKRLSDEIIDESSLDASETAVADTAFALNVPDRPASRRAGSSFKKSRSPAGSFELAYTQFLFSSRLALHASCFYEAFSTPRPTGLPPLTMAASAYDTHTLSRGFQIAGDIKPLTGLCITPIVAFHDSRHSDPFLSLPERSLGLDVSLGSVRSRGWSFSAAVQQLTLSGDGKYNDPDDRSAFDLSLTYHQKLSERLQLSLIGEHFRYPSLQPAADARDDETYNQRLFFLLHFTY